MSYDNSGGFNASQAMGSQQQQRPDTKVRPVTIKQVLEANEPSPDEETHIDNQPISKIELVGCIRNISEGAARALMLKIEDGTGNLEVKKWGDDSPAGNDEDEDMDEDSGPKTEYAIGQYVKILGSTRLFNGKRNITVINMRPITDYNEVIYHHTKALAVHLELTRGPVANGADGKENKDDSLFVGGNPVNGKLQSRILEELKNGNPDTGVHIEQLARNMNESTNTIMKEIDDMETSGVVYQGEENHYLPI